MHVLLSQGLCKLLLLDGPQKAEKRVGVVDADEAMEGTAEWVLWMMHQNPKEGESVGRLDA